MVLFRPIMVLIEGAGRNHEGPVPSISAHTIVKAGPVK
jgi:hypothetical protein